ncbi:hypothetical protein N3K66_005558 [Trichothecium roseum]|uniref:Uncharacterized protein n=1 Tax=Trichothecium roseum TaxID=47278 RepID=A0ACC0UZW6_9HYPO|nr:hypothetical protein N3K66_005558 [Trichothecium roseum]
MGFRKFINSLPCFEPDQNRTLTQKTMQAKDMKDKIVQRRSSVKTAMTRPRHDQWQQEIRKWSAEIDDDGWYNDHSEASVVDYDEPATDICESPPRASQYPASDPGVRSNPFPTPLSPHRGNYRQQQQDAAVAREGPSAAEPMNAAEVDEVISYIGRTFHHVPYAICGLSAMVHHGFRERRPTNVSVVCPEYASAPIDAWASSSGMTRLTGVPGSHYGVILTDGSVRRVRFKFMRRGFEALEYGQAGPGAGHARVLSLPALAERIASSYVRELVTASPAKQEVFALDMAWCLRGIVARGGAAPHVFAERNVGSVVSKGFWFPFLLSFPGIEGLFAEAGLRVLGDGSDGSPNVYYVTGPPRKQQVMPPTEWDVRPLEIRRPSRSDGPELSGGGGSSRLRSAVRSRSARPRCACRGELAIRRRLLAPSSTRKLGVERDADRGMPSPGLRPSSFESHSRKLYDDSYTT